VTSTGTGLNWRAIIIMSAPKKIAVAGATGRVGRHLVDILEAEGHEVAAMSRSRGVDIITGDGLAEALTGAEAIVDAATGPSPEEQAATEFFTTAARNLQEAGPSILEIAGPREERLVEMATLLAARRGDAARVEEVSDPADPLHAVYASGALLPGADATLAGPTFEEWLNGAA
jgi:hypothetical protein